MRVSTPVLPFRVPLNNHRDKIQLCLLRICNSPRRSFLLFFIILLISVIGLLQPKYNALDRFYSFMDFETEMDAPSWSLQHETTEDRHSLYTSSMFIPENLGQNHYIPITAVVDRVSKDEQAIYHSIQHILKYPFIKEIYINNKLSRRPLSLELFQDLNWNRSKHDHVQLHIIEPTSNEHDASLERFTTCSTMATYSHCYFQDDLALNLFMDTQYTNFLHTPHLIHANARPATFVDHLRWRFQRGNDLHVGYAQFRYGTIVQKSMVESFVSAATSTDPQQQNYHLDRHAEINFIIWSNQYPYLLANPLLITGDREFSNNENVDPINNRKSVHKYMFEALRELEQRLLGQSHEAALPQINDRHIRASCASDHCLFTTNINPFDEVRQDREFNIDNVTSIQDWESSFIGKVPTADMWERGAYHYAVDNNPRTCWNSYSHPREGDYFGLNMVGTIPAKRILVHLRRPMKLDAEEGAFFKVTVSDKKDHWVECRASRMKDVETSRRIAIHLDDCPNIKAWNAVRLGFKKDLLEPIQICSIEIDNMIV